MRRAYRPHEVTIPVRGMPTTFQLHRDGTVYVRLNGSLRRIRDRDLISAVHRRFIEIGRVRRARDTTPTGEGGHDDARPE